MVDGRRSMVEGLGRGIATAFQDKGKMITHWSTYADGAKLAKRAMRRRLVMAVVVAYPLLLAPGDAGIARRAAGTGLPASLSDHTLWHLSVDASEPNGYFRSSTLATSE